ncbi:MAG: DUF2141 domain-containing protein, partial [Gammaproteobacteria bacterium]
MKTLLLTTAYFLTVFSAAASANVAEQQSAARPNGAGSVEILIEGVSSDEGTIYASIYLTGEGFPTAKEAAFAYAAAPAADGSVVLSFDTVPAGPIAVAVLHDENDDQELSFSLIGYPKEAYGFSQNPKSMFGPPDFV